ncbi:NEW3 domain-containing protein [Chloroflexota bacterium]
MRRIRTSINILGIYWLTLLIVGVVITLSPCNVLAQEEKAGLTLRLVSGGYKSEVKPDEDNTFFLEVANSGTKTINNIKFSSDGPEGWVVEFRPEQIDSISVDNYRTVDINIRPPKNTARDGYTITVIADSIETRRVMNIFVRVETGVSVWLWIGAVLTAIVIAGFVIIFIRSGDSPKENLLH